MMQFKLKHNFIAMSVIGVVLIASVNPIIRVVGFAMCVIGNIYWIWYHKNITKDSSSVWVFIAYLIVNSLAIVNNYFGGVLFAGL